MVSPSKLEPKIQNIEALLEAGKVETALDHALEWVQQARDEKLPNGIVQALTAHGSVLTAFSRYKEALEVLVEALALCDEPQEIGIEAENLALLYKATGVAFGNSGVLEEALRYYELAAQTSPIGLSSQMHESLNQADAALYQAKHAGRNQVSFE
jgi:tetratricopeptide (TPR) repeat protein